MAFCFEDNNKKYLCNLSIVQKLTSRSNLSLQNISPARSSLGRFLFNEVSVWANWWARKGAMLWNFSPHFLHVYSRCAARRSCTCFRWCSRWDFLWKDFSHFEHLCFLSPRCFFSCLFKLSLRLNCFPQVEHSWCFFLFGVICSLSYQNRLQTKTFISLPFKIKTMQFSN